MTGIEFKATGPFKLVEEPQDEESRKTSSVFAKILARTPKKPILSFVHEVLCNHLKTWNSKTVRFNNWNPKISFLSPRRCHIIKSLQPADITPNSLRIYFNIQTLFHFLQFSDLLLPLLPYGFPRFSLPSPLPFPYLSAICACMFTLLRLCLYIFFPPH